MTEVVLLFPIFVIVVFVTAKMFALLVLVQKMEIASYYAARRWQLESHLNADPVYMTFDAGLKSDIEEKVSGYLGYGSPAVAGFLNLKGPKANLDITRTQVWNVLTLTVETNRAGVALICPPGGAASVCAAAPSKMNCINGYNYICTGNKQLTVIKYVPNRDRPIQFKLPGIH
ncbi:MAG: hypothetical protein HY796_01840 [Elusimicrobia bacterium]|nr:hypothetical protein [Elusimicrobiota bacterium]